MFNHYKTFRILLACIFLLNSSCIHTHSEEKKELALAESHELQKASSSNFEMQYLVYSPSKLPLSDFLFHLKNGDYNKALKKVNLNFKSSNFSNEALTELTEAGFVAVYVQVKNTDSKAIAFDEKSFSLSSLQGPTKAFYAEHLPNEFKHFSPKAVAANIFNTAVLVVSFATLLGVLVVLNAQPALEQSNLSNGSGASSKASNDLYNTPEKVVHIDYNNLLIRKTKLEPGQETKGLLFFNLNHAALNSETPEITFTPTKSP